METHCNIGSKRAFTTGVLDRGLLTGLANPVGSRLALRLSGLAFGDVFGREFSAFVIIAEL